MTIATTSRYGFSGQFTGEHDLNLDAKGRVPVPSVFRKVLLQLEQEALPIGLGPNGKCLRGYSDAGFSSLMARIEESARGSQQERAMAAMIRRDVMSNLAVLVPDGQGRVLLPANLRDKVDLNGECVFVGCGAYFELWNRKAWNQEVAQTTETLQSHKEAILAIYG